MLSAGQGAFFLAYVWTALLWLASEYMHWMARLRPSKPDPESEPFLDGDSQDKSQEAKKAATEGGARLPSAAGAEDPHATIVTVVPGGGAKQHQELEAAKPRTPSRSEGGAGHPNSWQSLVDDVWSSAFVRCLTLDRTAIQAALPTLRAMMEFGTLIAWYFVCDRTDIIPAGPKTYSRDIFLFLFVVLTVVAAYNTLTQVKPPAVLLVRQQTEEWKGWMQVLFLLYHYYETREAYSAIRVFIAAYVWMTGFGNFLYYYKTSDFSIGRFAQMMWRLNFLVFFVCIALKNSYMLYYICPMHTIFTVFVYASLGIAYQLNKSKAWLVVKVFVCWLSVVILWNKSVFYAMWSPMLWLVGYNDPRKPKDDLLHEWYFRSSLDRYIWIYGMICGMLHPYAQQWLNTLDTLPRMKQWAIRSSLIAVCAVVSYVYYIKVFSLSPYEYNTLHPYTSWIPITIWIILRNLWPVLRLHHLKLFGWLGCITLETYICQFHLWMKTGLPDGQPKQLMVLLPSYPMLNFALVTAGYVFVSHRLFELTNTLKNVAVPHSNNYLLARNSVLMAAACAGAYALSFGSLSLLQPAGVAPVQVSN